MGWRWHEGDVDGVSIRALCDAVLRSTPDVDAGMVRRNHVVGGLKRVRRSGVLHSIPDRRTGVRSNPVPIPGSVPLQLYWIPSGSFLVLLSWRWCEPDDEEEDRRHTAALFDAQARYRRFEESRGR